MQDNCNENGKVKGMRKERERERKRKREEREREGGQGVRENEVRSKKA